MIRKIQANFFSGLLILAPIYFTVLVLSYLVRLTDAFIVNPVFRLLPVELGVESRTVLTKVTIAFSVVAFVTVLGFLTREFLFRRLVEAGEAVVESIPIVNRVYRSFREIARAIFGGKAGGVFKRVVFVRYPAVETYALGFVTNESFPPLAEKLGEEYVNVFIPSPPNPATGYSLLVRRRDVIETDMTLEEGIKYSISCGVVVPSGKLNLPPQR